MLGQKLHFCAKQPPHLEGTTANPKEPIFSLIPIVSSSGEAGYCLDTSPDAIENMVLKWESRIAHLQQKVQNYPTT
jgi:hypothetical protein